MLTTALIWSGLAYLVVYFVLLMRLVWHVNYHHRRDAYQHEVILLFLWPAVRFFKAAFLLCKAGWTRIRS